MLRDNTSSRNDKSVSAGLSMLPDNDRLRGNCTPHGCGWSLRPSSRHISAGSAAVAAGRCRNRNRSRRDRSPSSSRPAPARCNHRHAEDPGTCCRNCPPDCCRSRGNCRGRLAAAGTLLAQLHDLFVSLLDLLELFFSLCGVRIVDVCIRMVSPAELAVGFFHFFVGRGGRNAEDLIRIKYHGCPPFLRTGLPAARQTCCFPAPQLLRPSSRRLPGLP